MFLVFRIIIKVTFIFFLFSVEVHGQSNRPWFEKQLDLEGFNYSKAAISIDGKAISYDDLILVPDSTVLSMKVYDKSTAVKMFGKEKGSNGFVFVTSKKLVPEPKDLVITNDSSKYYVEGIDTVFIKATTIPALQGDTSKKAWQRFLERNLNALVPVDNSAPSGIYHVSFRFFVNPDGAVSNVIIEGDPGYGTAAEVLRLMKRTPAWKPALYNGRAVKSMVKQKVTFLVSAM